MAKKFLVLALALMLGAVHVSAEQAAAEQYRQIFQSGNFYVECQRDNFYAEYQITNHMYESWSEVMNKQIAYRAKKTYLSGLWTGKSDKISLASKNGTRAVKSKLKDKIPRVMYQGGKYYNYLDKKHLLILPEEQLNSPVLDPEEGWQNIRNELALPEELAIFYWEDPFRDANSVWGAPVYSGSSTREVKKKTYDCDQYVSDIKSLAGTVIAQEVYNALYENGKLIMVQKFFVRNGKEILISATEVKEISAQVPDEVFAITKKIKTYAPRNGDMNDLLENYEATGEIGGAQK